MMQSNSVLKLELLKIVQLLQMLFYKLNEGSHSILPLGLWSSCSWETVAVLSKESATDLLPKHLCLVGGVLTCNFYQGFSRLDIYWLMSAIATYTDIV